MKSDNHPQSNQADQADDQTKLKDQSIEHQSDQQTKTTEQGGFENTVEPTRYGDWEIAGRCVDF